MGIPARPNFDIAALVQKSWQIVQNNALPLIGGVLLFALIQGLFNWLCYMVLGNWARSLGQLILSGPLLLGYYGMALRAARGQSVQITNLFDGFQNFLHAFLANLFISVLVGIGTVLCVLPGLFALMIYLLTYLFMSDRKYDFWKSLESSRQTIMADLGAWLPLFLVFLLLIIAGALACGIGLLITAPIAAVMLSLAYLQVSGGSIDIISDREEYENNLDE
ncbi:MAG: hypothetical protein SGI88_01765 [Candidatus Hydrogenedentes bacterium]|nr:hypothetical protein [Candidatus Hydrogenedentota bacterium]